MTNLKDKLLIASVWALSTMDVTRYRSTRRRNVVAPGDREKTIDERIAEGRAAPKPDPVPKFKRRKC